MVTNIKSDDGKIIAYCEWRLVGESGLETPAGRFVWVNDMWVHRAFRNTNRVNRIVDEIMRIVPQATHCYFQRKNKNTKLRIFTRDQWERRRMVYDKLIQGDN